MAFAQTSQWTNALTNPFEYFVYGQVGGVARFQNVLSSPTTGPQGWGAMVSTLLMTPFLSFRLGAETRMVSL